MPLPQAAQARRVLQAALTLPLFGSLAFAQSVIATIPAPLGPQGNPMTIAVNPLTERVYIACNNVEVVNQKNNKIIDTIDVGSAQLQGIAVDPTLNRAYVIDNVDGLFAIDLKTDKIVGNYPYSGTNGVAVNVLTHRVYMQAPNPTNSAAAMFVFDGPTLNLITIVNDDAPVYQPFGDPQDEVVVNPVTNKIYTSVNLYPGAIWVVDGNTNTSVTTIQGLADIAYGLDVDPYRNLLWLGGWLDQLSEVNGATNTLISTNSNTGVQPDGVAVDPIHQKVYLAIQQQNLVQIVDEKTNTILPTTIPVGYNPDNVAIDYAHGLLYVGNTGQGGSPGYAPSVSVIKLQ